MMKFAQELGLIAKQRLWPHARCHGWTATMKLAPDSWPMMCSSIPCEELRFLYFEAIIVSVSVHFYVESGRAASNPVRKRLKRSARCSKRRGTKTAL